MQPGRNLCQVSLEQEFLKNPELNKRDLDRLREWALSQRHYPLLPDEMLVWFLQSCYFSLEKAKACMECYLTVRSTTPSTFCNRDVTDPEFRKYIDTMNVVMLPVPDPNGYRILYHGLRDFEPANYSQLHDSKLTYMTTDMLLYKHGTVPGFVCILDLKGLKMSHLTKVNFTVLRIGSKYVQEGSPVRLKAVHFVNVISWTDKLMAVVKPFINKEMSELLHFHKEGSPALYNFIPRECLPCDLGGTLPSVEQLADENLKQLEKHADMFVEDEKLRIDESKRDKTNKKSKSPEEFPSHFNKLDID